MTLRHASRRKPVSAIRRFRHQEAAGGILLVAAAALAMPGAVWLCHRLGIAGKPGGASWPQIYGTALLCGIGFTMSLFIGGLAFADPVLLDEVKIGVLVGSLLSGLAGYAMLRFAPRKVPGKSAA